MTIFLTTLFWLLVAHALCDYPLQGDFLARGKNHKNPILGVPWQQCLIAHSIIHGGAVALITGNVYLGILETCAHAFVDFGKREGAYGFNYDQALHVAVKVFWAVSVATSA
jgi:hypothetical protein